MSLISTAAIQQTLDAQLATVPGLPTFSQENQLAQASGITPFCRSTLAPAKSTTIGLGLNPMIQQTGLYQVDLFYPVDYGFNPGRAMADAVISVFKVGFLLMPNGTDQLIIPNPAWSQAGSSYANDGAFWGIPVRVEWVIRTPQ